MGENLHHPPPRHKRAQLLPVQLPFLVRPPVLKQCLQLLRNGRLESETVRRRVAKRSRDVRGTRTARGEGWERFNVYADRDGVERDQGRLGGADIVLEREYGLRHEKGLVVKGVSEDRSGKRGNTGGEGEVRKGEEKEEEGWSGEQIRGVARGVSSGCAEVTPPSHLPPARHRESNRDEAVGQVGEAHLPSRQDLPFPQLPQQRRVVVARPALDEHLARLHALPTLSNLYVAFSCMVEM